MGLKPASGNSCPTGSVCRGNMTKSGEWIPSVSGIMFWANCRIEA